MQNHYNSKKLISLGISLVLMFTCIPALAVIYPFHNTYSGSQEVPSNISTAAGMIVGTYNNVSNTLSYTIIFSGLTTNATAAHFHGPAAPGVSAGVLIAHAGFPVGNMAGSYSNSHVLTEAQESQLLAGLWYSNIHSSSYPGGEIRAQIIMGNPSTTSPFSNIYSGSQEVPPNNSAGTGRIIGSYNHATKTINYGIVFSGLTANATAAHFHGPAAPGIAASVVIAHSGFPTATSGYYTNSHVLTAAQETQLLSGLWYSNIHTSDFPGGEIRAQITVMDILPPVISNPVATPSLLWPPNHKMKDVSVSYTSTDNFPGTITCTLSVSSDEPVTSSNDLTSPDWIVTSNHQASIRAERSGDGDGRIYTLTVTCTDAQGNSSSNTTTVTVPHNNVQTRMLPGNNAGELVVNVFPNPSRNYFMVDIQNLKNDSPAEIILFDVSGRMIGKISNILNGGSFRIGNELKPGLYFIEVSSASEKYRLKLMRL